MKKICFFMDSPFTLGGEQRVVTILANFLHKNGYDVFFLLTSQNNNVDFDYYKMDKSINIIFVSEYNKLILKLKRKFYSCIDKANSRYV